ncbi:type I methionyl aminopeptidase [Candidatus Woesebacteria bacterium]|nr:type I methionyl aminopeptidase [Candidatus Woesebacteria bacterium]
MKKETDRIIRKTPDEIKIMTEGGRKLGKIKKELAGVIKPGISAQEIDILTDKLIKDARGKPSFKMVPGYSWVTCVNINEGVVHGIPHKEIVFKKGDIVSVDLGLFYKGFHTDTSFSVGITPTRTQVKFLDIGKLALKRGIKKAIPGNRIFDVSEVIQDTLETNNVFPIRALVGHGIGRNLHEEPQVPCFAKGEKERSPKINEGMVLAIEVMYTKGKPDIVVAEDGWTISTKDGKIAGLFEETVAVTSNGPVVLTA